MRELIKMAQRARKRIAGDHRRWWQQAQANMNPWQPFDPLEQIDSCRRVERMAKEERRSYRR